MAIRHFLAVILVMNCAALSLWALQEDHYVDWTRGTVVSIASSEIAMDDTGRPIDSDSGAVISLNRGRINAYDEARELALERLAQSLKSIRIDQDNMLSDFLDENTITQSRISNIIARKVSVKEYPGGFNTSKCRAELKIGDILPAIPYIYPSHDFPTRIDNPIATEYTSLIIDTRGLDVEPMLLPSIFNENGLEIYGRFFVNIHYATKYGIVSYSYNEKEAANNKLAGSHPFYTVALKSLKGCPVISDRDTRKIFSSPRTIDKLKKCRVIFLIKKK